jgi:putative DNA primase/helicase
MATEYGGLMHKFNKKKIPKELRKRNQWVAWKFGKMKANGKRPKIPFNPATGRSAKTNDPATWGSFSEARQRCENDNLNGIGFVFTKGDPYCGIDLDNCRNPKTGKLNKFARTIVRSLKDYAEVSPSGKGVKIITKGKLPGKGINMRRIEMYDNNRYFTITGRVLKRSDYDIKR